MGGRHRWLSSLRGLCDRCGRLDTLDRTTSMATEVLPDDRALCSSRQRALDQMAAHDLDILVLGRQPTSGTSLVRCNCGLPGPDHLARHVCWRATGSVHGMKVSLTTSRTSICIASRGINLMNTISVLQRIDGATTARRVGTDGLSPVVFHLLLSRSKDTAGPLVEACSRAHQRIIAAIARYRLR